MGTPQSRKKVLETVSCSPEGVIPRGGVEGAGLGLVQNAEEQWAGGRKYNWDVRAIVEHQNDLHPRTSQRQAQARLISVQTILISCAESGSASATYNRLPRCPALHMCARANRSRRQRPSTLRHRSEVRPGGSGCCNSSCCS